MLWTVQSSKWLVYRVCWNERSSLGSQVDARLCCLIHELPGNGKDELGVVLGRIKRSLRYVHLLAFRLGQRIFSITMVKYGRSCSKSTGWGSGWGGGWGLQHWIGKAWEHRWYVRRNPDLLLLIRIVWICPKTCWDDSHTFRWNYIKWKKRIFSLANISVVPPALREAPCYGSGQISCQSGSLCRDLALMSSFPGFGWTSRQRLDCAPCILVFQPYCQLPDVSKCS